jgi:hypothetical protein
LVGEHKISRGREGAMWLEKLWYKALRVVFAILFWGFALGAGGIILNQTLVWLKTAIWVPYTIVETLHDWGFSYPYMPQLLGVQKIIDAILSWPASLGYFTLAVAVGYVWAWASGRLGTMENAEFHALYKKEQAERERIRQEEIKEKAARSKADFDFTDQVEELLSTGKNHREPE